MKLILQMIAKLCFIILVVTMCVHQNNIKAFVAI